MNVPTLDGSRVPTIADRPVDPARGRSGSRLDASLLLESDAGRDDGDPGRRWFPDFDEVE